ncbi:MAG TPA: AAA family ATPase [Dehalococcoidia bacterium]|nr:AAA family ATPase [Dehalococcoidia bacterium]
MANEQPATLGALRASGYRVLPVREEIRKNLIANLEQGVTLFPGITGYEDTVIPQLENAILSGHDIILLGERGQAKSRIIRSLTSLLDEWTPVIAGVEIPENPFAPISEQGRSLIEAMGDDTPIAWVHRDERYGEKLATPDITIADLIGEVDPIKVAEGRYLSDQLTIHFGLIPRTNRGIFAINELPDLAERIQVGLLNAMEERDVQIRGHKVRLPLDVFIVATANPEDYTNRGRIITPLKDRYGSQIRTHYPRNVEDEVSIIDQEAAQLSQEGYQVVVPDYMKEVVAEITRLARRSPDINQRSGVSVRASVADYEAMVANAFRRAVRLGEREVAPRISDLQFIKPALEGKVEFETVEDGREDQIVDRLIQGAVVAVFNRRCSITDLEPVIAAFKSGISAETGEALPVSHYQQLLKQVDGLSPAVRQVTSDASPAAQAAAVELVLEGLHLNKRLNKDSVIGQSRYRG